MMLGNLIAASLSLLGCSLCWAGSGNIYAYTAEDGSVSLSNVPTDARFTLLVAAPKQATAYCGVAKPAYCGVAAPKQASAYCGVAIKSSNGAAYCGVALKAQETAYCGVVIQDKLETSVRPKLALAA